MPSLLIRLAGPMQSRGTRSRFGERDTGLEPSKSGVIGLLCAALGIDRAETEPILELAQLQMGVRVDREGLLRSDFLTAQTVNYREKPRTREDYSTTLSRRAYLADAVFVVALEGEENVLLERIQQALRNPVWPLALGRKSYLPSPGIHLPDGLQDEPLKTALEIYPLQADEANLTPRRFVLESQSGEGSLRMDVPRSSFLERKFSARYVETFYKEVSSVLVQTST